MCINDAWNSAILDSFLLLGLVCQNDNLLEHLSPLDPYQSLTTQWEGEVPTPS